MGGVSELGDGLGYLGRERWKGGGVVVRVVRMAGLMRTGGMMVV